MVELQRAARPQRLAMPSHSEAPNGMPSIGVLLDMVHGSFWKNQKSDGKDGVLEESVLSVSNVQ
jgi:hypothetical protein